MRCIICSSSNVGGRFAVTHLPTCFVFALMFFTIVWSLSAEFWCDVYIRHSMLRVVLLLFDILEYIFLTVYQLIRTTPLTVVSLPRVGKPNCYTIRRYVKIYLIDHQKFVGVTVFFSEKIVFKNCSVTVKFDKHSNLKSRPR